MTTKQKSRIFEEVHEAAADLHEIGLVDEVTMREFDALCLPKVKGYTPSQIKRLRRRERVSQPVFALFLNVSKNTVAQWEQGEKRPSSPALKLLDVVERKGLEALA
jgi:putative transcriptional regulator